MFGSPDPAACNPTPHPQGKQSLGAWHRMGDGVKVGEQDNTLILPPLLGQQPVHKVLLADLVQGDAVVTDERALGIPRASRPKAADSGVGYERREVEHARGGAEGMSQAQDRRLSLTSGGTHRVKRPAQF